MADCQDVLLNLDALPEEVLALLLAHVPLRCVSAASAVSRRFCACFGDDELVWRAVWPGD